MQVIIVFFIFLFANISYSLWEIKYDALLEIQEVNANSFENFKIQYQTSVFDNNDWNNLEIKNSEIKNGNMYLGTGVDIKGKSDGKKVYFRIINTNDALKSDPIEITIFPKRVTFLKFYKNNNTNSAPSCLLKHLNFLPYYEIQLPVKRYENNNYNKIRLITPNPVNVTTPGSTIQYNWQILNFVSAGATVFLRIGKNDTELMKINVADYSEYNWIVPDNYAHGNYWWQIIIEYDSGQKYGSEQRIFNVGDTIDSDGDGYYDIEEIARCSDPNNSNDIPLLIMLNSCCTNGYLGQQYYQILKVNDNKRKTYWRALNDLPPGLVLSETGVLYGIPKGIGIFVFNIEVTNETNKKDQIRLFLNVENANQSEVKIGKGSYN